MEITVKFHVCLSDELESRWRRFQFSSSDSSSAGGKELKLTEEMRPRFVTRFVKCRFRSKVDAIT